MSSESCMICDPSGGVVERVRYYPRQLVTASVLTTDQDYLRHKARQHNRLLHGWGVVCGLEVKANPTDEQPLRITVCPGYLVDALGEEITIAELVDFDLATGVQITSDPCARATSCPPVGTLSVDADERLLYLAVCYKECYSRPERVPSAGCGCDEAACEYARIRQGFELKPLFELPESHQRAAAADAAWCEQVKRWAQSKEPGPAPVPPCPECPNDPWVVLARIRLPQKATAIGAGDIGYEGRRVLYSASALQTLVRCL